mmetsp:Transcript_36126/g.104051  ORF Transcript_36126/g.104051 Transcript_36126/m.104051 type:complete len:475 (+) Transcript_36126:76-1500(+)|eukprot:CAMPEP_0170270604 /NCGR_PEP_ID=MMETSP0116_2-20130129/35249_1 /TAXON_ID=400756 /ORGANISM="Durinskia baltica, Strain CSIRO CS-38" /LENGTH=474 /DNA_ID=CAMNT_0010521801 /DNA_START=75 /DNA_END=1499 /DNA_ORIENTATION=-
MTTPARTVSDEAINAAHAQLKETFASGRTTPAEWRKAQLRGLRRMCMERKAEVVEALKADLGRPVMESFTSELAGSIGEIDFAIEHLDTWMRPEKVATSMLLQPARSVVRREPKGVVLIMSPWNFPFNLCVIPLTAAIAAGNCVLLKPSDLATNVEALLARLLPEFVDPEAVIVVTGGVPEATALLSLRWDHIFYTGNGTIGKQVAKAAAEHLTPCTLELGGKSPTLVLPGANIPVAARRILAGKTFACGQICVAPDYALVHKDVEPRLVEEMRAVLTEWYGEDAATSDSFGRIVNERHFDRINKLLESAGSEVIAQAGKPDRAAKFMPPTLLRAPAEGSAIMEEEIFGPVLPIQTMDSLESMIRCVNSREKPLALYIFGSEAMADEVIAQTSSGTVCVNDTIIHLTNVNLPFGGVGASGYGRYHGKYGFDELSHERAVMYKKTWPDLAARYPPYTEGNLKLLERVMVGPCTVQ